MSTSVQGQKIKGTDTSDRKREYANQIRLKVAAKHNSQATSEPTTKNTMQQRPPSPERPVPQEKDEKSDVLQHQFKNPLSPMETYEMSDRADSDSDDSDDDDGGPKKKVSLFQVIKLHYYSISH